MSTTMARTLSRRHLVATLRSVQARIRWFTFRTTLGATNPETYADESSPYRKRRSH